MVLSTGLYCTFSASLRIMQERTWDLSKFMVFLDDIKCLLHTSRSTTVWIRENIREIIRCANITLMECKSDWLHFRHRNWFCFGISAIWSDFKSDCLRPKNSLRVERNTQCGLRRVFSDVFSRLFSDVLHCRLFSQQLRAAVSVITKMRRCVTTPERVYNSFHGTLSVNSLKARSACAVVKPPYGMQPSAILNSRKTTREEGGRCRQPTYLALCPSNFEKKNLKSA